MITNTSVEYGQDTDYGELKHPSLCSTTAQDRYSQEGRIRSMKLLTLARSRMSRVNNERELGRMSTIDLATHRHDAERHFRNIHSAPSFHPTEDNGSTSPTTWSRCREDRNLGDQEPGMMNFKTLSGPRQDRYFKERSLGSIVSNNHPTTRQESNFETRQIGRMTSAKMSTSQQESENDESEAGRINSTALSAAIGLMGSEEHESWRKGATTLSTPNDVRNYRVYEVGSTKSASRQGKSYDECEFVLNPRNLSTSEQDRSFGERRFERMSSKDLSTIKHARNDEKRSFKRMSLTELLASRQERDHGENSFGTIRTTDMSVTKQKNAYGESENTIMVTTTLPTIGKDGVFQDCELGYLHHLTSSTPRQDDDTRNIERGNTAILSKPRHCEYHEGGELGSNSSMQSQSSKRDIYHEEILFGGMKASSLSTSKQNSEHGENVTGTMGLARLSSPKYRSYNRGHQFGRSGSMPIHRERWRVSPTTSRAPIVDISEGKLGGTSSVTLPMPRQGKDSGEREFMRQKSTTSTPPRQARDFEDDLVIMHSAILSQLQLDQDDMLDIEKMNSLALSSPQQDRFYSEIERGRTSSTKISSLQLEKECRKHLFGRMSPPSSSTLNIDREYEEYDVRKLSSTVLPRTMKKKDCGECEGGRINSTNLCTPTRNRDFVGHRFGNISETPASTPTKDSDSSEREFQNDLEKDLPVKNKQGASTEFTYKKMFVLCVFLLCFPLMSLTISCIFGALFAWTEGTTFLTGFLYVASDLLGMANALTDFNPADPVGVVIDIYVSTVALLLFGIVLNVINLFNIPDAINRQIERFVQGSIIVPFIAIGVIIPMYVGVVAVVFGSILAKLEGWSVHDGIYYMLSNLLGLSNALVDIIPETIHGDIVDIIVSSVALGCVAIFVDYVTVLNPARYIRKRLKAVLVRLDVGDRSGDDIYNNTMLDDNANLKMEP